ncbi:MAG TPA: Nif3-like dinuclear metal center hexameric protein [Methanobacterium subterraneum]|uniref:Nif3-like dinuclear metal center hexameric protein n=1 Tax=Methanobacterium subterraneum TaxID=59277 RepID=A0A7J4TIH0_9EURY|nr:Nif3-like dinuclear metal center hexameric protein [Methanobacterium subterraneum]
MLASELFKKLEQEVPLELALKDDPVGFIGPGHPEKIEVEKASIMLDLTPEHEKVKTDLLVCHHPPLFPPSIPTYIIHSNWDIVQGGANDALAKSLQLKIIDVLEPETGIGRICETECNLDEFIRTVYKSIPVDNIKLVNGNQTMIKKVAIISGFGLNPHYIKLASDTGADLLLSGDLTHPGSILARKLGINIVDATHYATEVPGLIKLCQLIDSMGIGAEYLDTGNPWKHINYR